MRGNRVQAIVRELSNERIDIINWTDELSLLVRRVFSPAEVKRVIPVGEKRILVIIKEDSLAQAIGKEGQNIRLASKMLEKEIDVYGDEEFASFSEEKRNELTAVTFGESERADVNEGMEPAAAEEDQEDRQPDDIGAAVAADEDIVQAIVEDAVENVPESEETPAEEDNQE